MWRERQTNDIHKYRPILYTGGTEKVTGLGGLGACLGNLGPELRILESSSLDPNHPGW